MMHVIATFTNLGYTAVMIGALLRISNLNAEKQCLIYAILLFIDTRS